MCFGFIALKTLKHFGFKSCDMSVPGEGYYRNASCALNCISTDTCRKTFIFVISLSSYKRVAEKSQSKQLIVFIIVKIQFCEFIVPQNR